MNLPPLLLPGTSVSPNKDIYQFGNTLKEGQFAIIESCEPDNFYHVKDEHGHKFTISLTEINLSTIINCNDNRPKVNMDICLPGQVLISKSGKKYVFVKNDKENFQDFPYRLSSLEDFEKNGPDYHNCSRTVEGWTLRNKPSVNEDIVEIRNERLFTFEQVKAFLEENPQVLLDEGMAEIVFDENKTHDIIRFYLYDIEDGEEYTWDIDKENNSTISLVDSSFFAYDSVQGEEFQFQILTAKSDF